MTDLIPFTYQNSPVRVVDLNGEPWFVLADLCKVLDIKNVTQLGGRLDDALCQTYPIVDSLGRQQNATIVSEAGMYEVVIRSDKPEAVAFRRWITSEVLPQIRKTGTYHAERVQHQLAASIRYAQMQMELCQAAKGLIHPDHLEAKARIILAQGMGEKPQLNQATRPLYTQDFLKAKNLSAKRMRSVAGVFGKRVKAAYQAEHGTPPQVYDLSLPNGQIRAVNAYTEADRGLMDGVWSAYFAEPNKGEVTA